MAVADTWSAPNYIGELFMIGANQTPFLNMIGSLTGGKSTTSMDFPVAQPWALNSAAQPAITETASLTAPTATTYARGQDVNTVQVFHRAVGVTYVKLAGVGQVVPLSVTTSIQQGEPNPVQDELDFQIQGNLQQVSFDADYTFLNGAYVKATAANVAAKSRGIITAATTNTVNAAAATITRTLVNQLVRTMAGNGARFGQPVIFVNAFQKQKLTEIYGVSPTDRSIGGLNIESIVTDFARLGVVWAPNVPAATLLIADLSVVAPVFMPVPGKGVIFYEELSRTGAGVTGQIFGLIGLDHGPEEYHGTLTNLATS